MLAPKTWALGIDEATILLYTEESKNSKETTSSAWRCNIGLGKKILLKGHCQVGDKAEIEDGEIHAIKEGLRIVCERNATNSEIVLCVDNQIALWALVGGPTTGYEYVQACLEDVKILQQRGCRIREEWKEMNKLTRWQKRASTTNHANKPGPLSRDYGPEPTSNIWKNSRNA